MLLWTRLAAIWSTASFTQMEVGAFGSSSCPGGGMEFRCCSISGVESKGCISPQLLRCGNHQFLTDISEAGEEPLPPLSAVLPPSAELEDRMWSLLAGTRSLLVKEPRPKPAISPEAFPGLPLPPSSPGAAVLVASSRDAPARSFRPPF